MSGDGFSGVFGSLVYAALCDIGFTPKTLLVLMPVVPLVKLVAFLFIREANAIDLPTLLDNECIDESDSIVTETPPMTLIDKWRYLPKLKKYFIPMLINCLFEYFTSQMVSLNQI